MIVNCPEFFMSSPYSMAFYLFGRANVTIIWVQEKNEAMCITSITFGTLLFNPYYSMLR